MTTTNDIKKEKLREAVRRISADHPEAKIRMDLLAMDVIVSHPASTSGILPQTLVTDVSGTVFSLRLAFFVTWNQETKLPEMVIF